MAQKSEREIINFITGKENRFVGDDCAVWDEEMLVVATDHFCENVHFDLSFMPPESVGWRLMAANASDVISMGSLPTHFLFNIAIPKGGEELALKIICGVKDFAKRYGIELLGGDTTTAQTFMLGATIFGKKPEKPLLRSSAKVGDFVYLAAETGLSYCGLMSLKHGKGGFEKSKKRFLFPNPYDYIPNKINELHAAIDISDSLGSELRLICDSSNVSASIDFDKIPIEGEVRDFSKLFSIPVERLVLGSGEEFVLLFTSDKKIDDAFEIGEITERGRQALEFTSKNRGFNFNDIPLFSHFG